MEPAAGAGNRASFRFAAPLPAWLPETPSPRSETAKKRSGQVFQPRKTRQETGSEHEDKKMFAVIKTGGKQYRVAANDVITIEKLPAVAGDTVEFSHVLMLGGATVVLGAPTVAGATVAGELVEQARGPKVISFKKRRRQNSRRKKGHRQDLTVVRITEILTDGAKPSKVVKAVAPAAAVAGAAVGGAAVGAMGAAGALDTSNLSLISGIGPTIEKKLRAAGITSWQQIADWSEADLETWDKDLALRGRAKREEWVEQAKELLAGKPPRAKADKAEQKSGEDW
jgi:large subunit ribosomal protein L21